MTSTVQHRSSISRACARFNSKQTRKGNIAAVLLASLLFASLIIEDGCGGSSSTTKTTGTHPATYTFSVLHSFTAQPDDGGNPIGGVVLDAAGNLYGTTEHGGPSICGCGTVFKVDPTGAETVLYSFTGGADGGSPQVQGGLVLDAAGNLYGTTAYYGPPSACGFGCGVVFKLDTTGAETVLHSFRGPGPGDGEKPDAGLLRDAAGNLFGTTMFGGVNSGACTVVFGCGVVFKLDPSGVETVLYRFTGGADGQFPEEDLIQDAAGNLYGTTPSGGASGNGVVFKLDATGTKTVLYSFAGGADGAGPQTRLVPDAAGNLYGITPGGGATGNGVVFKLDAAGTETVLYSFAGGADGAGPVEGLVMDTAGNLYGTTSAGGATGSGVVFKLDTTGKETVLYSFTGGVDGALPLAGLVRDAAGNLYGTAAGGGLAGGCGGIGCGVVFKLTFVP